MDSRLENFVKESKADNRLHLLYMGNEGFLYGYQGFFFASDPYLSYYTDLNCSNDLVTWKRRYAPPFEGKELTFVSLVTLSHSHYDHSDPYTIASIESTNPNVKFLFPKAEEKREEEYHLNQKNTLLAKADEPITFGPLKVIPIPSAHEEFHQDKNGDYFELGYIYEIGPYRIFHAGDMCPYEGLQERLGKLDIALMPINGRSKYKKEVLDIIGNFNSKEALSIACQSDAKLFIPMHYDLYDVNSTTVDEFLKSKEEVAPQLNTKIMKPGEALVYRK